MMKKNNEIPWEEHSRWFDEYMCQSQSKMFFHYTESTKIGVIRFNFQQDKVYEVSINLYSDERGKGLEKDILEKSIETK